MSYPAHPRIEAFIADLPSLESRPAFVDTGNTADSFTARTTEVWVRNRASL